VSFSKSLSSAAPDIVELSECESAFVAVIMAASFDSVRRCAPGGNEKWSVLLEFLDVASFPA